MLLTGNLEKYISLYFSSASKRVENDPGGSGVLQTIRPSSPLSNSLPFSSTMRT